MEQKPEEKTTYYAEDFKPATKQESEEPANQPSADYPEVPFEIPRD